MSIVQWLLLILIVIVVAVAYWYIRRHSAGDPWQGMDDPVAPDESGERGEGLGGDSYIVGVRTVSRETPEQRKAAVEAQQNDTVKAEPSGAANAPGRTEPAPPRERPQTSAPRTEPAAAPADSEPAPASPPPSPPPAAAETPADAAPRTAAETRPAPSASRHQRVDIRAPRQTSDEQEIFILHVASPDGRFFDGPDIYAALAGADLKFGLNDIYHRVTEVHGVTESVFAVANMLNPGTLDPVDQDQLSTPGLTMFLVVPGALAGRPAMHDMMETANQLAGALGGEVLDDQRVLLKAQTAQYMLDKIADIDRRAQLARRR